MKKVFLFILLSIFFVTGFSQKKSKLLQDTVVWRPDVPLKRSDYKGKPTGKLAGGAYTALLIYTKEEDAQINFVVEAIFVRKKSFIRDSSEYIMKHEQGHFDLCELYARKLREKISNTNFLKVKNIKEKIQSLYNETIRDLRKENEMYDEDTEHSQNMVKQTKWNEDIIRQLDSLDTYNSTEVEVNKK